MQAVRLVCATVLCAAALGCGGKDDTNPFVEARVVMGYFDVDPGKEAFKFHAGLYKGGSAVRGPDGDAYWVKDGQGYAVNEKAKELGPDLPAAPPEIVYGPEFEKAVGYTPPPVVPPADPAESAL